MRAAEQDPPAVLRLQTHKGFYAEEWSLLPHSSVPEPISAIRRVRSKRFANLRLRSGSRTRNSRRRRAAPASQLGQCPLLRPTTRGYFSGGPGRRAAGRRLRRVRANRWQLDRAEVETDDSCVDRSELHQLALT